MKLSKRIIAVLLVVLLTVSMGTVAAFATAINTKRTNYSLKFDGYDGYGTWYIDFDQKAFEAKFEKRLARKIKDKDVLEYLNTHYMSASSYFLSHCVSYKMNIGSAKIKHLCNSDKVTLELGCRDEKVLQDFGVKLKYKVQEYEVTGLGEVKTIDLFDGVTVEFSGTDQQGYAQITVTSAAAEYKNRYLLNYELNKRSGLSNGDIVVVTISRIWANEDVSESLGSHYGVKPEQVEKEFKVEGLEVFQGVDLFDGVSVKFEGVNKHGTASIVLSSAASELKDKYDLIYLFDKNTGLSNGDTVVVTVERAGYFSITDFLEDVYGQQPKQLEKEFKVEGLESGQ